MPSKIVVAAVALSVLLQPISIAQGSTVHHARALKQGAGVGAGCDSILEQADNGSGYTVEDIENTLGQDLGGGAMGGVGKKLLSYLGLHSHKRALKQGAGVGAGCNSILEQADNGSGYTVEDIEDTLGKDLGGNGMAGGNPGGASGRKLSQANKIADGANVLLTALHDPQLGQAVDVVGNDYDNQGTNDAAAIGQMVGNAEASLPEVTQAIPGRKLLGARGLKQANKIADGANVLLTALHDPQLGQAVDVVGNDYDNQGTNDAAAIGQMIGNAEASLPEVTQAIPGRKMLGV